MRLMEWQARWRWGDQGLEAVESGQEDEETLVLDFTIEMPDRYSERSFPGSVKLTRWPDDELGVIVAEGEIDIYRDVIRRRVMRLIHLSQGEFSWGEMRERL